LIPVESPVGKNKKKHSISAKVEETLIRLHNPLINQLMCSATERRTSAHFTVAKLIIPAFTDIKGNGPVSRYDEFALAVTEWIRPGMPARTPIVFFASE